MKAQNIYNITMAMIDEYTDAGVVDVNSTKDYLARTPSILTMLATQVGIELKKVDPDAELPSPVTDMETDVELEEEICISVLTKGLAGALLITEDTNLSNYFNSSFLEGINKTVSGYRKLGTIVDKTDEYNITNLDLSE